MTRASGLPGILTAALAAGCLAALSACSAVRFGYNQLDWLIERKIANYVSLDSGQDQLLEARVEALLDWHCRSELQLYADWLRRVEADFQASLDPPSLKEHVNALREAWRRLMASAAPAVAEVAGSLTDRQVAELLAAVDRDNEEYRAEYVEPSAGERRRARAERMQERLRGWLGSLSETQRALVRDWSRRVSPMAEAGLVNRMRWRSELAGVLAERGDPGALAAGFERLMVHWREYQSAEYRRRLAHNLDLFAALMASIDDTMTPRQERRLSEKLLGYAADMEALSCRSAGTATLSPPRRDG